MTLRRNTTQLSAWRNLQDATKATWLGMSSRYTSIQKHPGDIQTVSSAGQGTTFSMALPLQREGDE